MKDPRTRKQIADFRSDTVTLPTRRMYKAILDAELGDDWFGEDPTVIRLEEKCARLTGKEAAFFGREAAAETLDEFCNVKTVYIDRTGIARKPRYGLL